MQTVWVSIWILNIKDELCHKCREKKINYNAPTNKTKSLSEKIAYIIFKILGYLSLLLAFGGILTAVGTEPGVVGFFIILPITLILTPVLILGAWFSLIIWHDRTLNIIKALTIFIAIALFVFQNFDWVILFLLILYGVACINIGTERLTNFINRVGGLKK